MNNDPTQRWMDVLAGREAPQDLEDQLAAAAHASHAAEREAYLASPPDTARNVRLQNMLEAKQAQAATAAHRAAPPSVQRAASAAMGGAGGHGAGAGAMGWGRLAAAVGVGVAAAVFFGLRPGSLPEPDAGWQTKGGKTSQAASAPSADRREALAPQAVATAQPQADAEALRVALGDLGIAATLRAEAEGTWRLEAAGDARAAALASPALKARGLAWPVSGPLVVHFVPL
jgi:hypothetical protein